MSNQRRPGPYRPITAPWQPPFAHRPNAALLPLNTPQRPQLAVTGATDTPGRHGTPLSASGSLAPPHFFESGRKDLAARGRGSAHEQFTIAIPRDGGIQDLLAEAERPDRRFDHVICESIDRIARRTYYVCAPKKGYVPEGHPRAGTFFVREDLLLDRLNEFLSEHVFGSSSAIQAAPSGPSSRATTGRRSHLRRRPRRPSSPS